MPGYLVCIYSSIDSWAPQVLAHLVKEHMDSSDITQDPSAPLNYTALATQTEGYSVTDSDLKDLVARAVHRAARAAIRSSQLLDDSQQVRHYDVRTLPVGD